MIKIDPSVGFSCFSLATAAEGRHRHPVGDGNVSRCGAPLPQPALKQEKPTLGSALIHGETLVWSANITAKQLKYRVILCF